MNSRQIFCVHVKSTSSWNVNNMSANVRNVSINLPDIIATSLFQKENLPSTTRNFTQFRSKNINFLVYFLSRLFFLPQVSRIEVGLKRFRSIAGREFSRVDKFMTREKKLGEGEKKSRVMGGGKNLLRTDGNGGASWNFGKLDTTLAQTLFLSLSLALYDSPWTVYNTALKEREER